MSPPAKQPNKNVDKVPAPKKNTRSKTAAPTLELEVIDDEGKTDNAGVLLTQVEEVLSEVEDDAKPVAETPKVVEVLELLETPKKKVVPSLFALSKARVKVSPESREKTVSLHCPCVIIFVK